MATGNKSLDLFQLIQPEQMATQIARMFQEWELRRQSWLNEKREVRNYIFATDTRSTTNQLLPWKNSTHVPKLCQIRDNLHANYMAALFPNDRPIAWEGDDESSEAKDKRKAIEAYMENKTRMGGFRTEMSKAVLDLIDYGNCFGMTMFVAENTKDDLTGEEIPGYIGPKFVRISPLDIVFNPTSNSFRESPKIVRELTTLGSLKADILDKPELGFLSQVFDKVTTTRQKFNGISMGDAAREEAYQIDGFSNWLHYFQSDYVELLHFYGDLYDITEDKLYKNHIITVVDRSFILRNIPNPSWLGEAAVFHCGWRLRPDNLYAMGPLDNLVGMQYRIDHLENAKADAFDLIVHPVMKVKGFVEDFEYGPGERIFTGDEGDVEFMRTDLQNIVQADSQIAMYEQKMEEMAGAPKQAMGFRTPGEKTAYEVQVLENGANRVFINKTSYFEEVFVEPAQNSMLEIGRRNMGLSDLLRVMDDQYGVVDFLKVTRDDITARGKIRAIGARHFARNANILQNLTQWHNTVGQDPSVSAHISGKAIAYLSEELLGFERYNLVQDNIRVIETMETQRLMQAAQQINSEQGGPSGSAPGPGGQPPGTPDGSPPPNSQGPGSNRLGRSSPPILPQQGIPFSNASSVVQPFSKTGSG